MLKDKKIIVTGGSGFLGSHLVRNLINEGISLENIFIPRKKNYDLRLKQDIKKMFSDFGNIDIVIHLAADSGGIEYYNKHPGSIFYNNFLMGSQLMEISRLNNVKKFVIIGTGLIYPKNSKIPLNENYIWDGYPEETAASYGLSSRLLLAQSQFYRKEYGFNSIYLIPSNLYGPGDHFEYEKAHVIPSLIMKFDDAIQNNKSNIEVWGTGKASREFLYVEDAAMAISLAVKYYNNSEPINIGTGICTPIKEIVNKISKIMKYNGEIIWRTDKPEGQTKRCFDISRSELLNFKPRTSINNGLKKTIEWYKSQ